MLYLRVVCASSSGRLHVAVDHGAASSPEAVPHQERVLHLRVGLPGLLQPLKGHGDVVVHLLRGKVEGVVVIEDDEAMEAIVLGDVQAVVEWEPRTRPKTSAGVLSSGAQNGSPLVRSISRCRSGAASGASKGREARSSLKRAPSRVTRLVTRTILCSCTVRTEPKVFSTQPTISSGTTRRPVVGITSKRRSASSR